MAVPLSLNPPPLILMAIGTLAVGKKKKNLIPPPVLMARPLKNLLSSFPWPLLNIYIFPVYNALCELCDDKESRQEAKQ